MTKPTKAEIVDAALKLVRLMQQADESTLDSAHCAIALRAVDSAYAAELEPLNGVSLAFISEFKRRAWQIEKK